MKAYRYKDVVYSNYDAYNDTYSRGTPVVELQTFTVVRETPKGFWIEVNHYPKWVSKETNKKYACLTKEEALESYIYRKKRQIRILTSRLGFAKDFLDIAQNNKL